MPEMKFSRSASLNQSDSIISRMPARRPPAPRRCPSSG
jgi:hypothetical protein